MRIIVDKNEYEAIKKRLDENKICYAVERKGHIVFIYADGYHCEKINQILKEVL